MSTLKNLALSMAITLGGISACNYTVGECYYRDEGDRTGETASAGGGVIISTGSGGVGGFGDAPPKPPQDATNPPPPECNIVEDTPCNEKCLADYNATALTCAQIAAETQRKACQDSAHAVYKSCREACEQNSNSDCSEKYQNCINYGPWSCTYSSGGKSQCARCQERCNAGASPSGACRKCLF